MKDADVHTVLSEFDVDHGTISPLGGAGGFSGALLWRISASHGPLCLRCWPAEHPSHEQLQWMHRVLEHVRQQGLTIVPRPRRTGRGESIVRRRGRLWELTDWLPGAADFHRQPSETRLRAALDSLARFHSATASFSRITGPPPGIADRLRLLDQLNGGGLAEIVAALQPAGRPRLYNLGQRLVRRFAPAAPAVRARLASLASIATHQQPCMRDVWHDHVLFEGDGVSGLIDFGAMRMESVAADIARLVGSLVADDRAGWETALEAYRRRRPLGGQESQLVTAYDQANVLLGGFLWLKWIYVEQRRFPDLVVIEDRLEQMAKRLDRLVASGQA